uniref:CBFD_NFYB_HMF domain-containing protein n=1 Tax=Syphacia muris TaxID=451379 RepID=A0A0N5AC96_9BILA
MEVDESEVERHSKRKGDSEGEPLTMSAGVALLPLARVKAIMSKESEGVPVSQEGLFAMSKATEMFIGDFIKKVYKAAGTSYIDYDHVADYVQENDEPDFLHDVLPAMVTYHEAVLFAQIDSPNHD